MKPEDIEVGRYEGKSGPDRDVRVVCPDDDGQTVVGYYPAGPTSNLHWCSLNSFARWAARRVEPPGEVQP